MTGRARYTRLQASFQIASVGSKVVFHRSAPLALLLVGVLCALIAAAYAATSSEADQDKRCLTLDVEPAVTGVAHHAREITQSPRATPGARVLSREKCMPSVSVKSVEELLSALKKASGGDTILLASGVYSNVMIKKVLIEGTVTLRPAPGAKVVFSDLNVSWSSGLRFEGVEFDLSNYGPLKNPVKIGNSDNISFNGVDVHGIKDADPMNDPVGIMILKSRNVSVENSTFSHLQHGVAFGDVVGLRVVSNSFTNLRTDAIRGGGIVDAVISKNFATNFAEVADHSDFIQLWNKEGLHSSNVKITENVYLRGSGKDIQGIFLRTHDGVPFKDFEISRNVLIGTTWHGIAMELATGSSITDNTIYSVGGQKSWIRAPLGVEVRGNAASEVFVDNKRGGLDGSMFVDKADMAFLQKLAEKLGSLIYTLPEAGRQAFGVTTDHVGAGTAPDETAATPTIDVAVCADGGGVVVDTYGAPAMLGTASTAEPLGSSDDPYLYVASGDGAATAPGSAHGAPLAPGVAAWTSFADRAGAWVDHAGGDGVWDWSLVGHTSAHEALWLA